MGGSGGSAEPPVLGWVPSRTGWVGEGWKEKIRGRKKEKEGRKERKKERKKGIREINKDIIKHVVIGAGSSSLSPVSRAICKNLVRNPVLMAHIE